MWAPWLDYSSGILKSVAYVISQGSSLTLYIFAHKKTSWTSHQLIWINLISTSHAKHSMPKTQNSHTLPPALVSFPYTVYPVVSMHDQGSKLGTHTDVWEKVRFSKEVKPLSERRECRITMRRWDHNTEKTRTVRCFSQWRCLTPDNVCVFYKRGWT